MSWYDVAPWMAMNQAGCAPPMGMGMGMGMPMATAAPLAAVCAPPGGQGSAGPSHAKSGTSWWVKLLMIVGVLLVLWWIVSALRSKKMGKQNNVTCVPARIPSYQAAKEAIDQAWAAWRALPPGSVASSTWMSELINLARPLQQPCVTQQVADSVVTNARAAITNIQGA